MALEVPAEYKKKRDPNYSSLHQMTLRLFLGLTT